MNLCKEKYVFVIKGLMCQVIQSMYTKTIKQNLILSLYLPRLKFLTIKHYYLLHIFTPY